MSYSAGSPGVAVSDFLLLLPKRNAKDREACLLPQKKNRAESIHYICLAKKITGFGRFPRLARKK